MSEVHEFRRRHALAGAGESGVPQRSPQVAQVEWLLAAGREEAPVK